MIVPHPAGSLPDFQPHEQRPIGGLVHQHVDRFKAQRIEDVVDHAVFDGKQLIRDGANHHRGKKVRQIHQRLRHALKALVPDLIEKQGQNHRRGEGKHQAQQRKDQRIREQVLKLPVAEELVKML